jgi:hypothetical protein
MRALCVVCRSIFTEEEIVGATCCPRCGNAGLPADADNTATVTLTAHEWRILTIWASQWASQVCAKNDQPGCDSVACINGVINEIRRQQPALKNLTMADELQEVADAFGSKVTVESSSGSETFEPKLKH